MKKLTTIIALLITTLTVNAQQGWTPTMNNNIDRDMKSNVRAGSCASPDGVMNYISAYPSDWSDLDNGGYCYQGNATTTVTTMVFTFVATSTDVILNAGFSESCANNSFGGFQLYDSLCNPVTTSLTPTGLTIGATYIWSVDMRAWGGFGCNGYNTFCPYVIAVDELPIELSEFNGDCNKIKWVTESELNNDYFTLERSVDGNFWNVESIVEGSGTTQQRKEYYVNVNNEGVNYYRLTQTDFNGLSEVFKVISIDCGVVSSEVVGIYNLSGQAIDLNTYKGIYIVRMSDGKTTKHFKN